MFGSDPLRTKQAVVFLKTRYEVLAETLLSLSVPAESGPRATERHAGKNPTRCTR